MPHHALLAAPLAAERLIIARLAIDVLREFHRFYVPAAPLGSSLDLIFVALSIYIGQAEARPMTASKLAGYLDVPHTTMLRKLTTLRRMGIVRRDGNHFYITQTALERRPVHVARAAKLVAAAAAALSKTDNAALAQFVRDNP